MRHWSSLLLLSVLQIATTSLVAQRVIATVGVAGAPIAIAVNPVTNKIYVSNWNGNSVTEIDGLTDATTTIPLQMIDVHWIAVNPVTNKIYVADDASASVTVIDGATHSTTLLTTSDSARSIAVNPVTNKVYVGLSYGGLLIIDGATLATTTVNVVGSLIDLAVNTDANKIYAVNDITELTVIDGRTLQTTTVDLQNYLSGVAVNPATNKIYVAGDGGFGGNAVFVVDGSTLAVTTVPVQWPRGVQLNTSTNKAYVPSSTGVIVIDGASNQTTEVDFGEEPDALGVDQNKNLVYGIRGQSNSVTAINGNNLSIANIGVGRDPDAIAVNSVTGFLYVANWGDDTITVVDGTPPTALQFVPVAPCRLVDTRTTGDPVMGGASESFTVPQLGGCNIPSNALAYSLNVTMVPPPGGRVGFLSIYPTGEPQPTSSLMNSWDGRFKANATIVPAGTNGAVSVFSSDTTNVVMDINGYFVPPDNSTLAFYPLPPCRVADTRWAPGSLGAPYLSAGQQRGLPVLESQCGIPSTAHAYSFNFTVIPRSDKVWVFTAWPAGQDLPGTSTLNAPTGAVVANAAIVPAGTGGGIDVWASNDSDLAVDVNGYFAPMEMGGLSLYTVDPCRVLDTRTVGNGAPFTGQLMPPANATGSPCAVWSTAEAFVFNATAVPAGNPLWLLTLWPDGGQLPNVSTLNAWDGAVTSNMAIVPTSNGSIDAYAAGLTQLILDISGYFAP